MSLPAEQRAASRQLPSAHGRDKADARRDTKAPRRTSETRMQAAVVASRSSDESDPYADVPCTD